jgi:hypothetical protein
MQFPDVTYRLRQKRLALWRWGELLWRGRLGIFGHCGLCTTRTDAWEASRPREMRPLTGATGNISTAFLLRTRYAFLLESYSVSILLGVYLLRHNYLTLFEGNMGLNVLLYYPYIQRRKI